MYSRSLLLPLAWSVSYLSGVNADCESYGIDFVNNGNVCHLQAINLESILTYRLVLYQFAVQPIFYFGHRVCGYVIACSVQPEYPQLTMNTGCAVDVAAVELVNWDTGDEYLCSDIPLQPDDTPETSTCDIEKDQMKSGTWGLILISNNGVDPDSPPFANQRTFYLTVGAQATSTVRSDRKFYDSKADEFRLHQH